MYDAGLPKEEFMHTHHPIHWLTDRVTGRVGRWVTLAIWLVAAGLLSGLAEAGQSLR